MKVSRKPKPQAQEGAEMTNLPSLAPSDDQIDKIAREIGLIVADHIKTMYPDAARAVAWNSATRSIQGVVRNAVASAGKAAERGQIDEWVCNSRAIRRAENQRRGQE